MKEIFKWSLLAFAVLFVAACSNDDDNDGEVKLNPTALFLDWGETATVSFSGVNIKTYSLGSYPEGWPEPVINMANRTLTVTAPEQNDELATIGSVRLNGVTKGGELIGASLYVALNVEEVDFSEQPANCYLTPTPNTHYTFDATIKGNGQGTINPDHLAVIWQTGRNLVQYLNYEDGKCSFYISSDNDEKKYLVPGNALIGAYDADNNLLWSWHIWMADYNPAEDALNYGNYTVMSRQLGALLNNTKDQDSTLKSYGLYYQWGRKDPFPGPASYNAASSFTTTLYDGNYKTVTLSVISSEEGGSYEYAHANPTHFITTEQKDADWCRTITNEVKGWSATTKTINDPCPYGWRVAPVSAFANLTIADDLTLDGQHYANQYGWTLTDGTTSSFYFAAGRRIYLDGTIQNLYDDSLVRNVAMEAQPWVGYNWTADGKAFVYWMKKDEVSKSGLRTDFALGRANGASVRCVRE
ncbi:MAG: hypothetical protein IKZ12_01130 [Alistipes sp.]|nr:hypothetical protein [Alistipes sp.]